MTGIFNGPIDVLLQLRDPEAAFIGATTQEDAVDLDFAKLADFKVVFAVAEVNVEATDTAWTLAVFTDNNVSLGSFSDVAEGFYEVPLSGAYVLAKDPSATGLYVKATQTGSGGDLRYGAYIAPATK